jgi:Excalibur calcium-binding domain
MTFRQPFKAVPIKSALRHRRAAERREATWPYSWLLVAALAGTAIGTGTVAATPEGRAGVAERVKPAAVAFGLMRERAPQNGDYWQGCDDARAAGTAPIYRGEPGYRAEMDGDNDGIACEPYY